MITNRWAVDFIASFAGSQDKQISSRQMGIFEKYAETRQDGRYTAMWSGKTADYMYTAIRYYVAGKVNYKVTVIANNDSIIAELQAELNRIDALMNADISD